MEINYKKATYWIIGIIAFQYLLSAFLQCHFLMNADVAAEFSDASRLYSGERYFYNIFAMSPPWMYLVDYPLIFLNHIFHFSVFKGIPYYYFFIITFSLSICSYLSYLIFPSEEWKSLVIFISFIAFIFLLISLPLYYGIRQHKMLIFCMPYFLLIVLHIKQIKISNALRVVIGVMAFAGFAISPYFVLSFLITELYYLIYSRKFYALFRIETLIILSLIIIYLLSILIFYNAYINNISPIISRFYYQVTGQNFWSLIATANSVYIFLAIIFFFINFKFCSQKILANILFVALIGFYISYIAQFNNWDYHCIPAISFAVLLFSILLCSFSFPTTGWRQLFTLLFVFACFEFDMYLKFNLYKLPTFYILSHFFICFCFTAFLFFSMMHILFKKKVQALIKYSLICLIFFYIFIFNDQIYKYAEFNMNEIRMPLLNYLKKNAENKTVYFFTATNEYEYPLADYAGAIHVSSFNALIWIWFYAANMNSENEKKRVAAYYINNYFENILIKDLMTKKPDLIFNEISNYKLNIKKYYINYINLFSQNPTFKKLWQSYEYVGNVNNEPYYDFEVYKRKKHA